MRCLHPCAVLAIGVAICGNSQADDKKTDAKPATTTYTSVSEIENVVLAASPGDKSTSISLHVDQKLLANAASLGSLLDSFRNRNAQQMKNNKNNTPNDVSLELTPDVVVRRIHLPPKKDEKGRTIAYTEKEKKELKGDSNLKGYNAELSDLKAGQTVTLHIVKLKGAKGDDAKKVFANRIFIQTEGQAPSATDANKNKKP